MRDIRRESGSVPSKFSQHVSKITGIRLGCRNFLHPSADTVKQEYHIKFKFGDIQTSSRYVLTPELYLKPACIYDLQLVQVSFRKHIIETGETFMTEVTLPVDYLNHLAAYLIT